MDAVSTSSSEQMFWQNREISTLIRSHLDRRASHEVIMSPATKDVIQYVACNDYDARGIMRMKSVRDSIQLHNRARIGANFRTECWGQILGSMSGSNVRT